MSKIQSQIEKIQELTSTLKNVEDEYQTEKEFVSELWKKYFPAAERKKKLGARRKQLRLELKTALDKAPELKALLKSIG